MPLPPGMELASSPGISAVSPELRFLPKATQTLPLAGSLGFSRALIEIMTLQNSSCLPGSSLQVRGMRDAVTAGGAPFPRLPRGCAQVFPTTSRPGRFSRIQSCSGAGILLDSHPLSIPCSFQLPGAHSGALFFFFALQSLPWDEICSPGCGGLEDCMHGAAELELVVLCSCRAQSAAAGFLGRGRAPGERGRAAPSRGKVSACHKGLGGDTTPATPAGITQCSQEVT